MIVDFDILAAHGFDYPDMLKTQGWENYSDLLKGPIYLDLVKYFWADAYILDAYAVCSNVKDRNICIREFDIARLLQHDNYGVCSYNNRALMLLSAKSNYSETI